MKTGYVAIPILVGLVVFQGASQDAKNAVKADSKISKVTVYIDRALVTRTAELDVKAGVFDVEIQDLPNNLQDDSVRARVENAKLISAEVKRYTIVKEQISAEKVKELVKQKQALQSEIGGLNDQAAAQKSAREFVESLKSSYTKQASEQILKGEASPEQWKKVLDFISSQLLSINTKVREISESLTQANEKLRITENELARSGVTERLDRKKVTATIEARKAGKVSINLEYMITPAAWLPTYDMRVSWDGDERKVEMVYGALVSQRTGEDWENVQVELSAAQPNRSFDLPTIKPWVITYSGGYAQPQQQYYAYKQSAEQLLKQQEYALENGRQLNLLRNDLQAQGKGYTEDRKSADAVLGFEPADQEAQKCVALNELVAISYQQVSSYVFRLPKKDTVPSDGSPRKITIAVTELPSEFEYVSYPRYSKAAFIKAKLTNNKDYPLLPGIMNVFFENTFVGATKMNPCAPKDTFEVSVGLDDEIKVERKLEEKKEEKSSLTKISYVYKIKITNLKREQITLNVLENIPVSRTSDVEIIMDDTTSKYLEMNKDGVIKWKLTIDKGKTETLTLAYKVYLSGSLRPANLD